MHNSENGRFVKFTNNQSGAARRLCEAMLCQLHETLKSTQKAYQFDTACIEFRIAVAGSVTYVQDVVVSLARCYSVTLKTAM